MKAYIARDKNGRTHCYTQKPHKNGDFWTTWPDMLWYDCIKIHNSDIPEGVNPQWSDDEPIEVELKIEKI